MSYLFLDVDGVINPWVAEHLGDDWRQTRIDRYWVWTSLNFGAWLNSLIERGVTIVWATTWIENEIMRNELCLSFGLDLDWPCIDRLEWGPDDVGCGKRPGLMRFMALHDIDPGVTPVVWVDDCLGSHDISYALRAGITPVRPPNHQGIVSEAWRSFIEEKLGLLSPSSAASG